MKISELKENEKVDILEVKVIWDRSQPKALNQNFKHKKVKTIIVADISSVKGDGSPTVMLDIYDDDIDKFKFMDQLLINDAFCKKMNNGQLIITNAVSIGKIGGGLSGTA